MQRRCFVAVRALVLHTCKWSRLLLAGASASMLGERQPVQMEQATWRG